MYSERCTGESVGKADLRVVMHSKTFSGAYIIRICDICRCVMCGSLVTGISPMLISFHSFFFYFFKNQKHLFGYMFLFTLLMKYADCVMGAF